jgi:hypothetical protein
MTTTIVIVIIKTHSYILIILPTDNYIGRCIHSHSTITCFESGGEAFFVGGVAASSNL